MALTENKLTKIENNDASERLASGGRHKQSNDHMRQNHRAIITDVSTQSPVMQQVTEIANGITGGIAKEGTRNRLDEGSLAAWKKETFDVYAEQVKRLNKLYDTFETERGQCRTKKSIQQFNAFAKEFNVHLEAAADKLDGINRTIHQYNDSQQKKLPIQELPEEVRPISTSGEVKSTTTSWKPSWKHLGVAALALTQLVNPVSAHQSTNALAKANGFPEVPTYLPDRLVSPLENQPKDAVWEPMTTDALFTPKKTEHHSLERRQDGNDTTSPVLVAQTDLAEVYIVGNNSFVSDFNNTAQEVAKAVGADHANFTDIFGGIKPEGLPYTVYLVSDLGGGAAHAGCSNTMIYATPYHDAQITAGDVAAEMVEVFGATSNKGWDCNFTKGESLSRVLAVLRHPEIAYVMITAEAIGWWNNNRTDYISNTNGTETNQDANGCGTLFLYYLRNGLGYDWKTIVGAGGSTLAETYSKLAGKDSGMAFPSFKDALQPFVNGTQLVLPANGNPWAPVETGIPGPGPVTATETGVTVTKTGGPVTVTEISTQTSSSEVTPTQTSSEGTPTQTSSGANSWNQRDTIATAVTLGTVGTLVLVGGVIYFRHKQRKRSHANDQGIELES